MMEDKIVLTTNRCVLFKGYLWFVSLNESMICKTSIDTWETKIIVKIPNRYCKNGSYTYDCGAVYDNRLILFPELEDWILDYDIQTNEFHACAIECLELDNKDNNGSSIKFRNAAKIGEKVYFMPYSSHRIIEYDLIKKDYIEYSDWYDELFLDYKLNNALFIDSLVFDGSIWFLCRDLNALMEFDLNEKKSKLHFVGDDSSKYGKFNINNNIFILWDYGKSRIVFWSPKTGLKEYPFEKNVGKVDISSFGCIYEKEIIIIAPFLSREFVVIKNYAELNNVDTFEKIGEERYLTYIELDKEKVLFITQSGNENMIFNKNDNSWTSVEFFVEAENVPLEAICEQKKWEENGREINIRKFLNYVKEL